MRSRITLLLAALFLASNAQGAEILGLKKGTPELKSAGPLAFGPSGILLVGDTKAAALFAISTDDVKGDPAKVEFNIDGLNKKVAQLLGASTQEIVIHDLVVNPLSGNLYLSVSAPNMSPAIVRVSASGKLSQLSLKDVAFSKATLPNPPEDKEVGQGRRRRNYRDSSITDLAYVEGKIIVAGRTNGPSPTNIRELTFPFTEADHGTSIEIFHGAHGRLEDSARIRVIVPFNINGEPSLLAGFVCTPLVKFPLSSLKPGKKTRGTTIAELGNRNQPLDMIVYKKGGKDFLLVANSARGVMKVSTEDIERKEGIEKRVSGTAGQSYETVPGLKGVVQLDRLNDDHAIVLIKTEDGALNLKTIDLP